MRDHVDVVLRAVAERVRSERIARAGLPESTLTPLQVSFMQGPDAVRTADQGVQLSVLGAVLVLLALLMATGAFYPAIDAIAGDGTINSTEAAGGVTISGLAIPETKIRQSYACRYFHKAPWLDFGKIGFMIIPNITHR